MVSRKPLSFQRNSNCPQSHLSNGTWDILILLLLLVWKWRFFKCRTGVLYLFRVVGPLKSKLVFKTPNISKYTTYGPLYPYESLSPYLHRLHEPLVKTPWQLQLFFPSWLFIFDINIAYTCLFCRIGFLTKVDETKKIIWSLRGDIWINFNSSILVPNANHSTKV